MIDLISFDFYNTLATFDPPRDERQRAVCLQFGFDLSLETIRRAYVEADHFYARECGQRPPRDRTKEEQRALWLEYYGRLLAAAGLDLGPDQVEAIWQAYQQTDRRLVTYDDAIPALQALRAAGFRLAVISNADWPVEKFCDELALSPYFDAIVTSCDAGWEKPDPRIFAAALDRVGAAPQCTAHVGDQYFTDVAGARRAGLQPILLDRWSLLADFNDCLRIGTLGELGQVLAK